MLLGRKAMTYLDSILKSRAITLPTKVHLVKAMIFPVVMYRCESWTIKKAEHWRTDVFELWCWRRLSSVPWTARRSNQSILKEISPEYSLEGLMLKLKLQSFGHLMRRTDSFEKTLMLGKIEGRRRRGRQEDEMGGLWATELMLKLSNCTVEMCLLLLLNCSVVSDSLRSHGLQHPSLPCPSPSPGACLNLCHPNSLVMPSNHLILCCPLLLLPSVFPSIRVFSKRWVYCS